MVCFEGANSSSNGIFQKFQKWQPFSGIFFFQKNRQVLELKKTKNIWFK